jgi:heterodisulfide reductase subunit B
MPKYLFYPGCSLTKNARAYLDSMLAMQGQLGIELEEINDWNCCGATEYVAVHHMASWALIGRNLALAAQQVDGSRTVMAPCSLCYMNMAKTDTYMRLDSRLNEQVNTALAVGNLHYTPGSVKVRHLLDIIVNDVGLEAVKAEVVRPLRGIKIAPYYGCMIARPDRDHRWDDVEHPRAMDRLMTALGAEVVDFPMKTQCCGGHMTQIDQPVAYDMIRRLVHCASEYQADVMVTLCPMCQLNLDAYQVEMNRYFHTRYHMPILYFTQLMGLAFGLEPEALGFGREFVDSRPALSRIGIEVAVTEEGGDAHPKRVRKVREGLPMPRMTDEEGSR